MDGAAFGASASGMSRMAAVSSWDTFPQETAMPVQLSDVEIAKLVSERKQLPDNYESRVIPKTKRGHAGCELAIVGADGSQFYVAVRKNLLTPIDFSVILAFHPVGTNKRFHLRRYNGKSHEHTNFIEKQTFYDFHVHYATERYQRIDGKAEESYAEPTSRFADWRAALECMIADCSFVLPRGQDPLFSSLVS
jgi:hypothetical protein